MLVKRKNRRISIPVIAMSDIAFLLLIFLMVSSMSPPKKSISVVLPRVMSAEREKMKNSEDIFVTKEGKYFIGKREVSVEELDNFIFNISGNKNVTVFVHADEETEYNCLDTITQLLYKNGLQKCLFVTKTQKSGLDYGSRR